MIKFFCSIQEKDDHYLLGHGDPKEAKIVQLNNLIVKVNTFIVHTAFCNRI